MTTHSLKSYAVAIATIVGALAAQSASAVTIVGPLNAVTGIKNLVVDLSTGGQMKLNASFVTGAYNTVFKTTPPTFYDPSNSFAASGNAENAVAEIAMLFNVNKVTGLVGPTSSAGTPYETFYVPYTPASSTYVYSAGTTFNASPQFPSGWSTFSTLMPISKSLAGSASTPAFTYVVFSPISPVPEPASGTLMLAGFGVLGLVAVRRRPSRDAH